ncbi:hypothetical protein XC49_20165 [Clostridioides difficile]|nr:DUF4367 domain-containing protein [Clostridioides difficile]EJA6764360.1 DUF4367 domain-containing protein [Clostridioides difficile]KAK2209620.1 hypothetical protein XC23_19935 [Clostridioides difficile]KAK2313563.1 hypothetical protein XC49_20165 [Clostridioides difficile]MBH7530473.1 DUF4367 domain-containing protein [Clostridioides difficile]
MLQESITIATKIILDDLPSNDELNHVFSKGFERKMKKLIKQQKRSSLTNKLIFYSKRTAIVFLIVLASLFTITMSSEALRSRFFELVIRVYEDLTSFVFSTNEEDNLSLKNKEPEYIPKGFKEVDRVDDFVITYKNDENIEIQYVTDKISSNSIILDTENAKVKDIFVNGYKAKYIRKGTFLQLFWNDNNFIYLLNVDYQNSGESEFYEDILIKIAKSIK